MEPFLCKRSLNLFSSVDATAKMKTELFENVLVRTLLEIFVSEQLRYCRASNESETVPARLQVFYKWLPMYKNTLSSTSI